MADVTQLSQTAAAPVEKKSSSGTFSRVAKYTLIRVVTIFFTVVVAIYLTILIANMGGYVDEIKRGQIQEQVAISIGLNPVYRGYPPEERMRLMEAQIVLLEKRAGLDKPFLLRSVNYLADALTLNLGFAESLSSDSGSRQVRLILLERLPSTLVLFGTANLILFFTSVFMALALSRRYGSFLDKMIITLAPTSAAPAWFYGIFLLLFFAALLGWLPFGGMVDAPPPDSPLEYGLSLAKHMILPVLAWFLSAVFISTYNWRTFFLVYSSEDYVELAKAKGLSPRDLERRYILRPTLPAIITSFALLVIGMWTGAIILETVFNWPGLGRTLFQAIGLYDTPVIVASTVIYAYLLAVTVLLLDFVYALVDPRVKIGSGGSKT